MRAILIVLTLALLFLPGLCAAERLNVLFIASDDLRPELGCYGHPQVQSPHIDRLAAQGTLFNRSYCQQAVCNPSRASLLTGLYPETLQVFDLPTHFRDKRPNAVTIPQHFKNHGYHSERVGKIFHVGHGNHDDELSWSRSVNYPSQPRYAPTADAPATKRRQRNANSEAKGAPWQAADVADDELLDGGTTDAVIGILNEVKDQPFFVACGFANPHLPFVAPKKYWDLYDRAKIELPANPFAPRNAPEYAATSWGELRAYLEMPKQGPLTDAQAREAIHGYWAAVSYVDAQIGRLLDELDRLQLREKTVVILWGDHGWQLGEHGFWCKHTNYEVAARVPLIISVPGQTPGRTDRLVEFVDIFPSLCEACDLPIPAELEGTSCLPLVQDPNREWKSAVFHVYPRTIPGHGPALGRAIRTDSHRLVEWKTKQDGFTEYELYDLTADPQENENVAGDARYASTLSDLTERLHAGHAAARAPARQRR